MRALTAGNPDDAALTPALHCLLAVPPLVNYVLSRLLEPDLLTKHANAVGFALAFRALAAGYWEAELQGGPPVAGAPLDASEAVRAFRRVHRSARVCPSAAVGLMYGVLQDAVGGEEGSFLRELGGGWVAHEPDCPLDTVQNLFNHGQPDAQHLLFVRLDRGDRPRKWINYGTSAKLVRRVGDGTPRVLTYDLQAVMTDDKVLARHAGQWWEAREGAVGELLDVNDVISGRAAQVLAFLIRC